MIGSALIASCVIFAVLGGWVVVDRWFKRVQQHDPDGCDIWRHECGHCLMMDSCVHRHDDDDGPTSDY